MKTKTAWKILKKGMKSEKGDSTWKKGQWKKHDGEISLCESGFHASHLCIDAMYYVTPGIICKVEYKGNVLEEHDKFVCSEMKVVETYRFNKRMVVELAVYSARLCLKNFERKFPNDKRPREAIEAAENYVKNPTEKNKSAARSAAESAWSAAQSAWSAAESARSAAKQKIERKLLKIIGVGKADISRENKK
jgi:hypothetical protein